MNEIKNDLPELYRDIPLQPGFTAIEKVEKGWSREQKYRVFYDTGDVLLRVRPKGDLPAHQKEFDFIRLLYDRGLNVPRPLAVGQLEGGEATYMLLSWVPLLDLSEAMPGFGEQEQYALGLKAGRLLHGIHHSPRFLELEPEDLQAKYREKMSKVKEAGIDVEGLQETLQFVDSHLAWLLEGEPLNHHGDFHPGNLVINDAGEIYAIDFNRFSVSQRAEEFYKIQSFTIESSVPFALGQLHGYFGGDPDEAFWRALTVHVAASSLYSIRWANPFGEEEVRGMVSRYDKAFADYEGFTRIVPAWYRSFHQVDFDK